MVEWANLGDLLAKSPHPPRVAALPEEEKKTARAINTPINPPPVTSAMIAHETNSFNTGSRKKRPGFFQERQRLVDQSTRERWKLEQRQLRDQLVLSDEHEWQVENPKKPKYLKYVAGLDVSYSKIDFQRAVAALVICEYPSMRVLYDDYEFDTASVPYIPGFLAFKEVPAYLQLFERLKKKKPELWPQVLLVDGNGIFHNRSFGCACHIGVITGIPAIGCGKTVFAVDGLT